MNIWVSPFFLILSLFIFTFPGMLLLTQTKINFSFEEKFFLGTSVGLVAFTFLTYLSLIVGLEFPVLIIFLILGLYQLTQILQKKLKLKFPKQNLGLFLVFIIGILFQLAVIAPSGIFLNQDLVFWSAHGHDGPWHIALMNEINQGFPLQNPVFAGERLVNYHFFSDIAPAMFQKYFNFSPLDFYFRFFPFLYSLLLGTSVYFLTKNLSQNRQAGIWAVILTYFAGSFGYLATLSQGRGIGGESIFWATQIQSSSGNPPQIISNFILLTFLTILIAFLKRKGKLSFKITFLILVLLAGSLAVFKVYAAIVLLLALGVVSLTKILLEQEFELLFLTLASGLLAAILYLPNTQKSQSFLIFEPWWFIRTMIVEPSRLNWLDHELRRQHYLSLGTLKAWARIIQLETTAFLIFFFGNLGIRFLAFFEVKNWFKEIKNNPLWQLIFLIIIFSLLLPLLFLQKGVASNTSQFLQYFLLLFGIFGGIAIANLLSKVKNPLGQSLIGLLILLLAVPTQVALLRDFYQRPPLAKISQLELKALSFLKNNTQTNAVILTPPYNQYLDLQEPTPPIWDWFDTAYVSAFSQRRTYFDDFEQIDIMGYDFEERRQIKFKIFETEENEEFESLIKQTQAGYLYFPKIIKPIIDLNQTSLTKVFENEDFEIWKI